MYKSPDFEKIPVRVENSFAYYKCEMNNYYDSFENGPQAGSCNVDISKGTYVEVYSSQPALCYTMNME